MKQIKKALLLLITLLAPTGVYSQEQSLAQRLDAKLQERFINADVDHDGHLSVTEAKDKMAFVSKNFTAIDTTERGSVTLDEIRAYVMNKKNNRK